VSLDENLLGSPASATSKRLGPLAPALVGEGGHCQALALGTEAGPKAWISGKLHQGVSKGLRTWWYQQSRDAVLHHIVETADIGSDYRDASAHGFEGCQRCPFVCERWDKNYV
jgi:hypothetical protein